MRAGRNGDIPFPWYHSIMKHSCSQWLSVSFCAESKSTQVIRLYLSVEGIWHIKTVFALTSIVYVGSNMAQLKKSCWKMIILWRIVCQFLFSSMLNFCENYKILNIIWLRIKSGYVQTAVISGFMVSMLQRGRTVTSNLFSLIEKSKSDKMMTSHKKSTFDQ